MADLTGAMRPNWFDEELGNELQNATTDKGLERIFKTQRMRQAYELAVKEAKEAARQGQATKTFTQFIRTALAEALNAN